MKRVLLAVLGLCSSWAVAGGGGQPPAPHASPRTVPVLIFNFTPGNETTNGPFLCADGQAVFAQVLPDALRLTRRGEVFVLPKLTKPDQYGQDGVSWVKTGQDSAELTLGRTQPVGCRAPQSGAELAQRFKAGAAQLYRCAGESELWVIPFRNDMLKMVVVVSQSHSGQAPVTTTLLPQVRSASGIKYQSSQWTWLTNGREGRLEWQGKVAAQQCQTEIK
ncbi:MliC family protein [Deinococcus psychrotolerans]|nr:MliC family protein [Deinococcus psychrotolerans]